MLAVALRGLWHTLSSVRSQIKRPHRWDGSSGWEKQRTDTCKKFQNIATILNRNLQFWMNNVWTSFKLMNNHTKRDIVSNSLENIIVRALWWQRGRTSAAHYTKTLVCVSPTCRPRTPQLCQTSWLHSRRQSSLAALQPGKRSDRAHTWKKKRGYRKVSLQFLFYQKETIFSLFRRLLMNRPRGSRIMSAYQHLPFKYSCVSTDTVSKIYPNLFHSRKTWHTSSARAASHFI